MTGPDSIHWGDDETCTQCHEDSCGNRCPSCFEFTCSECCTYGEDSDVCASCADDEEIRAHQ